MGHKLFERMMPWAVMFFCFVVGALLLGHETAPNRTSPKVSLDEAKKRAMLQFQRADLDGSGALDADEFATLTIVTGELARLNGVLVLDAAGKVEAPLTDAVLVPLSREERFQLDALARQEFRRFAGGDDVLCDDEFTAIRTRQFKQSDLNNDDVLSGVEIASFVQIALQTS